MSVPTATGGDKSTSRGVLGHPVKPGDDKLWVARRLDHGRGWARMPT